MNKKLKLVLSVAAIIVVLAGSYKLYEVLSELYENQMLASEQQWRPGIAEEPSDEPESAPPAASESETVTSDEPGAEATEDEDSQPEDEEIKYLDVELEDMEGNKVMFSDYVGDGLVVINFWATWCGPCTYEMPGFNKVESEYADKNVTFLMVNLTDGVRETKDDVEEYLTENEFDFQNVLCDVDGNASITYGVSSIPATLFIDSEGNIVYGWMGVMEEETLKECLDELLLG